MSKTTTTTTQPSPESLAAKADLKKHRDMLELLDIYRQLDPTDRQWVRCRIVQIDEPEAESETLTPGAGE